MTKHPIETAPRDRAIILYSADKSVAAIWYFGDWGTIEPILGDRIDDGFEPTHWSELTELSST